jgi:hypothetical protein
MDRLSIRDEATIRRTMQMLKLDHLYGDPVAAADEARALPQAPVLRTSPAEPAAGTAATVDSTSARHQQSPSAAQGFELNAEPALAAPSPAPDWLNTVSALAPRAGAAPEPKLSRPLFPKRQSRALLGTALATWDASGTPDIPQIVDRLARLQPITQLPVLMAPTLRRGAQILVDTSIAMAPFLLDVERVQTELRQQVTGQSSVVVHFKGCPLRPTQGPDGSEQPTWKAPPRGTPILMLTDLGIGGPPLSEERAGITEWLDFLKQARNNGSDVVALVPYPPRRWPRLGRLMHIIHWDRRTTAAAIRNSARQSQRAP